MTVFAVRCNTGRYHKGVGGGDVWLGGGDVWLGGGDLWFVDVFRYTENTNTTTSCRQHATSCMHFSLGATGLLSFFDCWSNSVWNAHMGLPVRLHTAWWTEHHWKEHTRVERLWTIAYFLSHVVWAG